MICMLLAACYKVPCVLQQSRVLCLAWPSEAWRAIAQDHFKNYKFDFLETKYKEMRGDSRVLHRAVHNNLFPVISYFHLVLCHIHTVTEVYDHEKELQIMRSLYVKSLCALCFWLCSTSKKEDILNVIVEGTTLAVCTETPPTCW